MSAESFEPVNPNPPFIATAPVRSLLATLEHGLGARAPILLLTGEPGTGKSMLATEARSRWGDRVTSADLPAPAPEPAALAATLLELFGGTVKSGASIHAVMERLINVLANATSGGRVAVLVADDAHTLSSAHLLELHRIAGVAAQRQCPLELLLVGLPALAGMFDEPELAALRARVSVRVQLAPLSVNDAREYLQLRPNSAGGPSSGLFSRKACRDIHSASLGVLATIEALAAEATRRALRASSNTISPEHVRAAANALRAGRADDVAHTLPPRQQRAEAVVTPSPRSADPSAGTPVMRPAVETRAAAAAASAHRAAASDSAAMDFTASNDPRVKAWVARFGGSGVRIGVRTPQRMFEEPEPLEDASFVVTKRTNIEQFGKAARAIGFPEPAEAAPPVEAEPLIEAAPTVEAEPPVAAEPLIESAPVDVEPFVDSEPPDDAPVARASKRTRNAERRRLTAARRTALAATAKPAALEVIHQSPEPRAARASVPSAPARRPPFKHPSPLLYAALGVALVALAINERDALGRLLPAALANAPLFTTSPTTTAPVAPLPPAPRPHKPAAPAAQYAIAVGSYPTRDMARAECDNLGRLVPMRVTVAPPAAGTHGYRLLLGRFDSAAEAELSMHRLQGRGLIPAAKPVVLPSATSTESSERTRPAPHHAGSPHRHAARR